MINIFEKINFKNGIISNNSVKIFENVLLKNQTFNLTQDIVQIYYVVENKEYTIDLGWYPEDFEVTEESYFWIRIIEDDIWDNILFERKCTDIQELISNMEEAILWCSRAAAKLD